MNCKFASLVLVATVALCSVQAPCQTDVAASVYGAFSQSTTGNFVRQSPSNAAGVLLELRQVRNPLVGYEVTYAYNRANQSYANAGGPATPTCGPSCYLNVAASVPNNAHEITGDWVLSFPLAGLRPFALAGGGLLLNVPSQGSVPLEQCNPVSNVCTMNTASTSTSTKGVFVYGAGLDWTLLPHLGLRFQYRGNLYKAAALTNAFSSTDAFTHTAEPMIGIFLRF
ncbi:MAG: outer membrane beta-barrel protein [Acidobacteriota bacterium]